MRKDNVYYRAAEFLAECTPFYSFGCCYAIGEIMHNHNSKLIDLFCDYLMPTKYESKEYYVSGIWWMYSIRQSSEKNHNDRILALLLMAEITDNLKHYEHRKRKQPNH